ncbi:hypothetical protein ANANG_G00268720 [Anguilla anguilla]|uniref:Uncharacterized protein n=1 Tax=Anguilla anguilla TaxID=7936 RepID=A0A9D3LRG4_ANGAN|nr:hypothetical protein ANANG_G00268720 [Anguilla anguilla]
MLSLRSTGVGSNGQTEKGRRFPCFGNVHPQSHAGPRDGSGNGNRNGGGGGTWIRSLCSPCMRRRGVTFPTVSVTGSHAFSRTSKPPPLLTHALPAHPLFDAWRYILGVDAGWRAHCVRALPGARAAEEMSLPASSELLSLEKGSRHRCSYSNGSPFATNKPIDIKTRRRW